MPTTADDNQALLLQVSAKIDSLEKQFKKASGIVDQQSTVMERRAKKMAEKLESVGKIDIGKALDNVFDSSRLKIMDSGIARIGLFGSALEPLGPLGVAAAAGIAAVGAALAGSREAAKFADDIGDTADRLHVTTNELQEYRYAIRAAGGDSAGADEALEAFSVTLGKAQEGLAKSQKAFIALGFTKDQIKGFADAGSALDAVRNKMQGLSDAQKDAIIDQFGLSGLKSLLAQSVAEQDKLIQDAHKLGLVMDSELVRRGGDLNDQFETLEEIISVQLKSALIDLGPILTSLLGIAADFSKDLLLTVQAIEAIQRNPIRAVKVETGSRRIGRQAGLSGRALERSVANDMIAATTKITPEFMQQWLEDQGGGKKGVATSALKDVSKTGSSPKDMTGRFDDASDSALASGNRAVLQALLSLTDDIDTRAKIQKQIADAEYDQAMGAIDSRKRDIESSNSTNKQAQLATLEAARAKEKEALDLQKQAIDRDAQQALIAQQAANARDIAQLGDEQLSILARIVPTLKARRDIELQLLANRQKEERDDLERQIASPGFSGDADGLRNALDNKQAVETRAATKANQGPLASYLDSVRDLNTAAQNAAVDGLQTLNQGIIDLALNGADAGNVLKNVLNRVLGDLLNAGIEKAEGSIFDYFKIGKNAGGTDNWRGGLTWVGERGRELVNLPKGSQVIPNHQLPSLERMSSARAGVTHVFAPLMQISADSSVVSPAWVDSLNAKFRQNHDAALSSFKRMLPGELKKLNTFGA